MKKWTQQEIEFLAAQYPKLREKMNSKIRETWKRKTPEEISAHIFKVLKARAAGSGIVSPREKVTWRKLHGCNEFSFLRVKH